METGRDDPAQLCQDVKSSTGPGALPAGRDKIGHLQRLGPFPDPRLDRIFFWPRRVANFNLKDRPRNVWGSFDFPVRPER
jgi:hypothetical protein